MLELTNAAKQHLSKTLATADEAADQDKCFRIVPKDESSLTLKLATPSPSDAVFTHDGDKILALPKALQSLFDERCLDIDDSGKLKLS